MVFASKGILKGSIGYDVLTSITAIIIVASTLSFVCLLVFEVYRSLKYVEPVHCQYSWNECQHCRRMVARFSCGALGCCVFWRISVVWQVRCHRRRGA
jgi:hypothetical protein